MKNMTIYVFRKKGTDEFKIGYTSKEDAEDRRKAAATFSGQEVLVECTFPGTVSDERALHALLAPWKTHGKETFELKWANVLPAWLASWRATVPYEDDPTLLNTRKKAVLQVQRQDHEVWVGRYGLVEVVKGTLQGETARYYGEDEDTGMAILCLMEELVVEREVALPHDWLKLIRED
jgi:hypothetical protein